MCELNQFICRKLRFAMPPNKRKATNNVDDSHSNQPVKLRRSERIRKKNDTAPCNLLDLNDDCLLEILLYLPENDLCALNNSCRQLKRVAEEFVQRNYKKKLFELKHWDDRQNFIHKFGKVVTRLKIDFRCLDGDADSFLLKDFPNLVELSLAVLKFSSYLNDRTTTLCQNLRYLSIASFSPEIADDDLRRFVLACTKLKSLNVYGRHNECLSTRFLAHRYPEMKEISVRKHYGAELDYQRAHIQEFLKQNPQIESVTFDFRNTQIDSNLFVDILNHSVNIKTIRIRLTRFKSNAKFLADIGQLHRLNNLVELDINCDERKIGSAIDALAATDTLQTLGLSGVTFDEQLVRALCKLK